MAKVLIAGCGYVGTALGLRLAAAGHVVWGLRRNPAGLPPGVRPLAGDLADPGSLGNLPGGLDYAFYTAGADAREAAAYRAAYVEGLRNLLEALGGQGQCPRRIFFTSSMAVYAQGGGEWVDEDSPAEPVHFSGRCILEGERLLFESQFPATVLRFAGIYGPGRTRLVRMVRAGEAAAPGGPPRYTNRIHRDDCAGALHHLMGLAAPEALYIGADHEPVPRGDLVRWLAARLSALTPGGGGGWEPLPGRRAASAAATPASCARATASASPLSGRATPPSSKKKTPAASERAARPRRISQNEIFCLSNLSLL